VKIFTYGTLKSGFRNHHLLRYAEFVDMATTSDRYEMIDVGFPVILPSDNGHKVHGEVYEVDADTMARLDRLEGEGRMYDRVRKYVRLASGELVRLYYYVGCSGFWDGRNANPVQDNAGTYDWRPYA
jgi:gamma-glutamylcyclotransferase (GGCT)/AIG2-like uncharacterized protein YtfP